MKILAFDTATSDLILCLLTENQTFKKIVHCQNGHSLILMSEIDNILRESNVKLSELDGIACVVGVGSFTGIRIGVSTARALCQSLKIPALAINSLFYRAYNVRCQEEKSVVMSASSGKVYYAKFSKENKLILPEGHCEIDRVLEILNTKDKIYSDIELKGANSFKNPDESLSEYIKDHLDDFDSYVHLIPHYLIKSQAENNYDKKSGRIRNWNANDIQKLCQIEKATFEEYWTEANYQDSLQNKNFNVLIYELDGEIVAYLSYCLTNFEIDIANLATLKDFRRQGIGRKLILYLLEIAKQRKTEKINLEVKVSNYGAISFYQSLGFSIAGTRKRFYSDTEDGYTMSLFLEELI